MELSIVPELKKQVSVLPSMRKEFQRLKTMLDEIQENLDKEKASNTQTFEQNVKLNELNMEMQRYVQ